MCICVSVCVMCVCRYNTEVESMTLEATHPPGFNFQSCSLSLSGTGHFSDSLWAVAFSFVSTRIAVPSPQGLCKDYLVSTGEMLNTASVVQLRIQ